MIKPIDYGMTWCEHLKEGTTGLTMLSITAPSSLDTNFPLFQVTLCPVCALRVMDSLKWLGPEGDNERPDPARPGGRS